MAVEHRLAVLDRVYQQLEEVYQQAMLQALELKKYYEFSDVRVKAGIDKAQELMREAELMLKGAPGEYRLWIDEPDNVIDETFISNDKAMEYLRQQFGEGVLRSVYTCGIFEKGQTPFGDPFMLARRADGDTDFQAVLRNFKQLGVIHGQVLVVNALRLYFHANQDPGVFRRTFDRHLGALEKAMAGDVEEAVRDSHLPLRERFIIWLNSIVGGYTEEEVIYRGIALGVLVVIVLMIVAVVILGYSSYEVVS